MSDQTEQTISADALCRLTGLTDRRHRQLAKEGWFPSPIESQYQTVKTLQGLFRYFQQRDFGRLRQLKEDREAEKLRKDRVEADLAEQKVSTKAELESAMTRFVMQLKAKQMVMPRSLSRELSLLKDPHEIETRLESVLRGSWESTDLSVCSVTCPECGKEIVS